MAGWSSWSSSSDSCAQGRSWWVAGGVSPTGALGRKSPPPGVEGPGSGQIICTVGVGTHQGWALGAEHKVLTSYAKVGMGCL